MSVDGAVLASGPGAGAPEIPAAALFAGLQALDAHRREEDRINLLQWVMALPVDLDPAAAARAVLDYQNAYRGPVLSPALQHLLVLVSRFSSSRLASFAAGRRRSRFHREEPTS